MAHDVFISHSSVNKTAADAICHALEQNGVKCWIAPRDISPGSNYGSEIIKGIKECKLFLLVFSNEVNNSPAVQKEVERAVLGYHKTVIPFRIEDVAMNENLEFFLTDVHWLDAFPDDTVFENLIAAIRNALGMGTAPVSVPVAAHISAPVAVSEPAPVSDPAPTQTHRQDMHSANEVKPLDTSTPDTTSSQSCAVGDIIQFGPYEWRVLDVQGDRALIITQDIIDRKPFAEKGIIDPAYSDFPYSGSSVRTYVDRECIKNFSEEEQNRIQATTIVAGRNRTTLYDKVFLLSMEEAGRYFKDDADRAAKYEGDASMWWLRDIGTNPKVAGAINYSGALHNFDDTWHSQGIRPAMWIKTDAPENPEDANTQAASPATPTATPESTITPKSSSPASGIPSKIPEDTEVFVPKGLITVVTDEGSEIKGIASGAFVGSGLKELVFGDLNLELPLAELKSIAADPYGMGEAKIVMMSDEEHEVEFESWDSLSFISAEEPYPLVKLSCLEIRSLVCDREAAPNVNLGYIAIECYGRKTIVVPNSFFEFSYFGWNPIKGTKSYSGQPVTYSYPNLLLTEKAELPFEEVELPIEEIASYHIKDMGNRWYKVVVTKKSGELIPLKTYRDGAIDVHFITNTGKEKLSLNEIKRITFLPLSS
ncbi:MAG: toll/interleukin-1 receptor domain-containing protein [Coriobacteriales bacterium]|jgi:hypothetical protein|nr:toll/interleukin-1 receptor domain-containing protein [Coriobacteriales bacterium]